MFCEIALVFKAQSLVTFVFEWTFRFGWRNWRMLVPKIPPYAAFDQTIAGRTLMFLSRRIATMEVEFVSIERVMEYTRLPHEEGSNSNVGTTAELLTEHDRDIPAVFAEDLYLRYEVARLWDSCPSVREIWQNWDIHPDLARSWWKTSCLGGKSPEALQDQTATSLHFLLKCHPWSLVIVSRVQYHFFNLNQQLDTM